MGEGWYFLSLLIFNNTRYSKSALKFLEKTITFLPQTNQILGMDVEVENFKAEFFYGH